MTLHRPRVQQYLGFFLQCRMACSSIGAYDLGFIIVFLNDLWLFVGNNLPPLGNASLP